MNKSRHITCENPWAKENSIHVMEGSVCPCCKGEKIRIVRENSMRSFRNHYTCMICGTEWIGNTYDSCTFQTKEESNTPVISLIFMLIFLFFFIWIPVFAFISSMVFVLLYILLYRNEHDRQTFYLAVTAICLSAARLLICFI